MAGIGIGRHVKRSKLNQRCERTWVLCLRWWIFIYIGNVLVAENLAEHIMKAEQPGEREKKAKHFTNVDCCRLYAVQSAYFAPYILHINASFLSHSHFLHIGTVLFGVCPIVFFPSSFPSIYFVCRPLILASLDLLFTAHETHIYLLSYRMQAQARERLLQSVIHLPIHFTRICDIVVSVYVSRAPLMHFERNGIVSRDSTHK